MKLHVRLGLVFRSLRRELGVTQSEVAQRAGRPRPDYSRFERGLHSPRLDHIERYAGILGVSVSDVLRLAEKLEHANTCEHGDHPAPDGKRFCSEACLRCEHESESENGCEGICGGAG